MDNHPFNPAFEPDGVEEQVLAVLKAEGRASPLLIRQEIDDETVEKNDVTLALSRLEAAGWISRRCKGLYDFEADPREADA